ncbi:flagellar motor protein MotB [Novosphingobium sp. 9]|uniref:flagellar motor protein MotB n=1 Tax=Novosphingobium sp. 9 TaxID=2025349 RepID=UPI0021B54A78|nr:flagellar motor protein MotB [Novosphingobium sp. 9]
MATQKNEPPRPIIVKKITIVAGGHHGGAWKVAYADFVTAMMAFFLLLWIVGATTEKQRKGIADYFAPTLVKTREQSAGSANGLLGGSSLVDKDNLPHPGGSGTRTITIPRDSTGGKLEGGTKIKRAARAKQRLETKLASTPELRRLAKQVRLVDTTEGVRVDLVDNADFSMFRMGTTVLTGEASALLGAIAQALGPDGGQLTVRGHTDALPYKPGLTGNNWSLSAGRAEATRQALIRDGMGADHFRRIEGVADMEPLIPADPHDPRNRRISITVLN